MIDIVRHEYIANAANKCQQSGREWTIEEKREREAERESHPSREHNRAVWLYTFYQK